MSEEVEYRMVIWGHKGGPFTWRVYREGACQHEELKDPANPNKPLQGWSQTYEGAFKEARQAGLDDYDAWLIEQSRRVETVLRMPAYKPRGHDELLPGFPVLEKEPELPPPAPEEPTEEKTPQEEAASKEDPVQEPPMETAPVTNASTEVEVLVPAAPARRRLPWRKRS